MARAYDNGHAALRHGRSSQTGFEYFLTLCAADRHSGLTVEPVATTSLVEMRAMERDKAWLVRCATLMPDHLHLLITLGPRLALGRAVQRLKGRTSATLRARGLSWERGFYDRRMRADDNHLAVFQYIYLNPYRSELIPAHQQWPHYYCAPDDWRWFRALLNEDTPFPEWLAHA